MGGGTMGAGILLWGLLGLVLLVLAVVATIWLVKNMTSGSREQSSYDEELRRRYAAGEIDREDYLRRREDLRMR